MGESTYGIQSGMLSGGGRFYTGFALRHLEEAHTELDVVAIEAAEEQEDHALDEVELLAAIDLLYRLRADPNYGFINSSIRNDLTSLLSSSHEVPYVQEEVAVKLVITAGIPEEY